MKRLTFDSKYVIIIVNDINNRVFIPLLNPSGFVLSSLQTVVTDAWSNEWLISNGKNVWQAIKVPVSTTLNLTHVI